MTTLFTPQTIEAAGRPSIAERVATWTVNFVTAWKNRRAFYHLGEMSDSELHDIGLTRGDLSVVLDLPFASDPTAQLGAMARRRSEQQLRARL